MRIFQIINVRWYNATAWYALYLSKLLQDDGHQVLVLTLPDQAPFRKAKELGLNVLPMDLNTNNPLRLAKAGADIVRLIREFEPDVVNCHRGEGFFLWGLLKKLGMDFKLVRTRGDQRLPKSDFFNRWLHRSVAGAVVVTNKRMAEHFLNTMRTPEPQVWLIRGGVDADKFRFDAEGRKRVRTEFGFSDDDFVIGLLGRFDRVKGQRELARTVARLRSQDGLDNVKLFFIGHESATKLTDIRAWIDELGIGNVTAISGLRDDVSACISALDLGAVPSLWSEAIARAALEIMNCGVPLVSSDVGVMPDLVPEAGVFPAGDEEAMHAVIRKAVTDEAFRDELRQAHERTMSQLDGANFLKRSLNLYQALLDEKF